MVITVTGSTGTIGTELVRLLSERRSATRAVLRNTAKLRQLPGIAWVVADLKHEALLEPVLAGTQRLFLLTSNESGFGRIQSQVIQAAQRLGVEHVVKLSALGASPRSKAGLGLEHWEAEQALQESGMSWTILRPHTFMQNWLADIAPTVRSENTIYSAIGDGRVPFIDARDIADVALETLLNPEEHAGKTYVLTGGEAVGFDDVAQALSQVTGRDIRYHQLTMDEARARMEAQGLAARLIDSMLALAAYQKAGGKTAQVSGDVAQILGRAPRNIHDFARDYKAAFTEKR